MHKIKRVFISLDVNQRHQQFIYTARWSVPKSERKLVRIFGLNYRDYFFDTVAPARMRAVLDNILYVQDLDKNIKLIDLKLSVNSEYLTIGNIPSGIYFTTLRGVTSDIQKTFKILLLRL